MVGARRERAPWLGHCIGPSRVAARDPKPWEEAERAVARAQHPVRRALLARHGAMRQRVPPCRARTAHAVPAVRLGPHRRARPAPHQHAAAQRRVGRELGLEASLALAVAVRHAPRFGRGRVPGALRARRAAARRPERPDRTGRAALPAARHRSRGRGRQGSDLLAGLALALVNRLRPRRRRRGAGRAPRAPPPEPERPLLAPRPGPVVVLGRDEQLQARVGRAVHGAALHLAVEALGGRARHGLVHRRHGGRHEVREATAVAEALPDRLVGPEGAQHGREGERGVGAEGREGRPAEEGARSGVEHVQRGKGPVNLALDRGGRKVQLPQGHREGLGQRAENKRFREVEGLQPKQTPLRSVVHNSEQRAGKRDIPKVLIHTRWPAHAR
mmetsp:Transcript_23300/g.88344  ORF Transcript_23300/g.88344 Transcript_23300/m.88344 type:complete len:387 (+) Transcript_23300:2278-3438(+)